MIWQIFIIYANNADGKTGHVGHLCGCAETRSYDAHRASCA